MGGAVDVPDVDGVAEWNAAADPAAFAAVLADGTVPVTIVPDDAIPSGTPEALDAPVVGSISAVYVTTEVVGPVDLRGVRDAWMRSRRRRRGRGRSTSPVGCRAPATGSVVVVTSLDEAKLEAAFEETFG